MFYFCCCKIFVYTQNKTIFKNRKSCARSLFLATWNWLWMFWLVISGLASGDLGSLETSFRRVSFAGNTCFGWGMLGVTVRDTPIALNAPFRLKRDSGCSRHPQKWRGRHPCPGFRRSPRRIGFSVYRSEKKPSWSLQISILVEIGPVVFVKSISKLIDPPPWGPSYLNRLHILLKTVPYK